MKILILGGGSGDVGRDVARILLRGNRSLDLLTVTARNMNAANDFVSNLDDNRVTPVRLDVTDKSQMIELMRKHDLIINVIGPFDIFGINIMKAAVEAKVNYIDICDDIQPTLEALLLDSNAKKAGIFLLLSMGWFPGISNIRAKQLSDQMEKVDEIVTAWVAGKKAAEEKPSSGIAGTDHYIKALTGMITTFRNGKMVKIPAYQKGIQLQFPEPLGLYTCYQLEHPEPITLPKFIPGVKTASNLGSLYPASRNKSIRRITRAIDFKILSRSFVSKFLSMQAQSKKKINYPVMNGSYIACIGKKDGKNGQLRFSATNTCITTAEATSQPLACAVLLAISGNKIKPGVHLPETSIKIEDLNKIGKKLKLPFFTKAIEETIWSQEVNSILK
ncbi:hypothetical protein AYK24_02915 [Thermoplasmatales archaeon SG8-52-4]|nr:MAG: hypothetical protein AYK24_02915 [Thermoplasmatales archaeon SG8-52-4]